MPEWGILMRATQASLIALGFALGLSACKADIKGGVFACDTDRQCPSGFACSARGSDPKRYCYSSDGADAGGAGIDGAGDGGPIDGGPDLGSDASIDGGGGTHARASASVRSAGFWSEAAALGAESYELHDQGFDRGVQMCTTDHDLCVTGGFTQ
jgi:hypothetical protein